LQASRDALRAQLHDCTVAQGHGLRSVQKSLAARRQVAYSFQGTVAHRCR
jgi:hypothetical protein